MNTEYVYKAALAGAAYFAPVGDIFIVMILFVASDLVAGILVSRKQGIPCTSKRLRKTIAKLLCYMATVILLYLAEKTFSLEWMATHKFIGGFICMVELISILENLTIITEKRVFITIIKIIRGETSKNPLTDAILNEKSNDHEQRTP